METNDKARKGAVARQAAQQGAQEAPANEIVKRDLTLAERFVAKVMKEFEGQMGSMRPFTEYEKVLAQHLFLKIDAALKEADRKRANDKLAINWDNVNTTKLATDAVNRIDNGLDALLPAHIYPIAYLNGGTGKYDIDLRIGYRGELYIAHEKALDKPRDIRLELVYSTDTFKALKKGATREVEAYEFEITNPFKRGNVIGAFAYIVYPDATKNELVIVGSDAIAKSAAKAGSKEFWNNWYEEMVYKTLVHKAVKHIMPDPKKITGSYLEAMASIDETRRAEDQVPMEPIEIPGEFDDVVPERPQGGTQAATRYMGRPSDQAAINAAQASQESAAKPGQQTFAYGANPDF